MTITHALTSERRKLTTVRLPGAVVALTAGASAFGGVINVHHFGPIERLDVTTVALDVLAPAWFLVVVVTVLAAASEFQHRTVVTSLLWTPRRGELLAAKGLVAAGFGALVCVVAIAFSVAAGVVTSAFEDIPLGMGPAEEWAGLLAGVVVGALFGVLSSALGLLTRSTAFALTALLLWKFVLEGIVPVVTHRPELAHWMPANVAIAFVDPSKPGLSTVPSGVLMLMYVAMLAVAGAATFIRRDP